MVSILLGLMMVPAGCAFADAGNRDGGSRDIGSVPFAAGAIAGGFFSSGSLPYVSVPGVMMPPAPVVRPMQGPSGLDLCGAAVARASASYNLPPGLLNAIAIVESGTLDRKSGRTRPWPWTIDANGVGLTYATEPSAAQAAAGFEAAGITSLDIGCLQVNLAQHPDAFQNLTQAFDPVVNAEYAAGFLTSLAQNFGNWPQAVAAYHSQTPALGEPYQARVYAVWQGGAALAAATPGPPARQALPMLAPPLSAPPQTAFQFSTLLPPARVIMQPQGAMTGRGLASYRAAPVAIVTLQLPQG